MIRIRRATKSDVITIASFQQKMAQETEELSLDGNKVKAGVKAVIDDPSKGFYIIAEESETIASMLLTPEWSDWRNGYFLWIQSLFVTPDYRKKGVFKLMYDFVKELVIGSNEYVGIKLYVDQHNVVAQKAYEKVGMESSHYRLFEWNK